MMLLIYLAFALIAFAVLLYVLMDGWDLGVGILFLIAAREQERDEMMGSIAPFWDGAFALGSIIAAFSQGMMLGKLVQGVQLQHGPYGQTFTITLFPLLCGMAMVSGYALLGSAWLVYKTDGATQTFGHEVSRAAWLLTMAFFIVACVWTPLSVAEVG